MNLKNYLQSIETTKMLDSLKTYFPHIEEKACLEYRKDKDFEILDDRRCYIVETNGQFQVINPIEKTIGFLAVDNCLFDSSQASRADCIIFDEKVICFIELKHCKKKNISKSRQKANKQLKAIIQWFQSHIQISNRYEAYICITCTQDDGITMIPKADNIEMQLEFEEEYNTALFYKCHKEFIQ